MNSTQVKDKLKNIAKEKDMLLNPLLRLYMYDRFIERLSLSKYKDNFILKGGFYLSTLFGVENRKTMDIDTAIVKTEFTEENIVKMIKEIISIELEDDALISFNKIETIRDNDEYGGYRVELVVFIDKMNEKFHIDIATGDPITPKAISYKYKSLLENKVIKVWAYNIETVLAEKLETILTRAETSGRLRDYYDVYLICTKEWNNINKDNLRKAIDKTFKKREFNKDIELTLKVINDSYELRERWLAYQKKNKYASEIIFEDTMKYANMIVKEINFVNNI